MVEPKFENGVWKCPICGFKAMSKKVVEMHIQKEHPSEAQSKKESSGGKPQAKKKGSGEKKGRQKSRKSGKGEKREERRSQGKGGEKGSIRKKEFKIGRTKLRVFDYNCINVKDQRAWLMFQNSNYVAVLHKQRVRVKLVNGEVFEGKLKARDPYFVSLLTEGGPIYINKAHILYIKPLEAGGGGG